MVRSVRLLAACSVAAVAFIAAWLAMLPGLAFWDTGELQVVAPVLGTAHPTGFPTYVLLGWLASVVLQPFGDPAFRMNVLSGLCLAVAAGVTVDLVRALTGRVALGIAAGIGLALTPIVWAIATHAEAHTLHLALVAILLWLLVAWEHRVRARLAFAPAHGGAGDATRFDVTRDRGDRYLIAAAFVYALAAGNHSLTLLLAIPIGLFALAVDPGIWRRGRLILACVAVLLVTLVLVYLELPLRAGPFRAPLVYGTPNTWDGFKYIVLAEQFQGSLNDPFGNLGDKFGQLLKTTFDAFGILALLIPFGFLVTALRRPRYALLTGTAVAITCFFNASYVNADISRYYVGPALMVWTWLALLAAGVVDVLATRRIQAVAGGAAADHQSAGVGTAALPIPALDAPDRADPGTVRARGGMLALLLGLMLLVPTLAVVTDRYRAVDMSRTTDASTWVDHVMNTVEPNAVILSWWSYSTPLWYAQCVEGQRPDVAIVDDRTRLDENLGGLEDVIDANLGHRPVYVLRLDTREVSALADRYQLDYIDGTDATQLTRVKALKDPSSSKGGTVYPTGLSCAGAAAAMHSSD
jgi:transmembrane protein TMEM260 (protein O-mannosyltransferase)